MINKSLEIDIPEEVTNLKKITNPHVQIRAGDLLQPNQLASAPLIAAVR